VGPQPQTGLLRPVLRLPRPRRWLPVMGPRCHLQARLLLRDDRCSPDRLVGQRVVFVTLDGHDLHSGSCW
jgi:hypothetical protein